MVYYTYKEGEKTTIMTTMTTTMTTAIFLYIALSLLAMIIIYGACLAAARADGVIDAKRRRSSRKAQPDEVTTVEQPQQKNGDPV